MRCGRVLLVLALVVVALAYFLYTPFPDGAVESRKQMILSFMTSTLLAICDFQEYIGYKTMHECVRNPFNLIPVLTDKDLSDNEVKVTDELFDGVKVRLFVQRKVSDLQELPALVFYHGGGWIMGSVDMYSVFTKRLSTLLPVVLVSVEYRLAPEHIFPIPLEDCLTATKYFMKNAKKFGVDASRIALSGDSAGGNLAMAVGIKLTQERQPPRLLALFYPALQIVDFKTPSYSTYQSAPYQLRSRRMVQFYLRYIFGNENYLEKFLKNEHITEKMRSEVSSKVNIKLLPEKYQNSKTLPVDPKSVDKSLTKKVETLATNVYLCPLMLEDEMLSQLPKTYLMTCEYDPLRDDGLMLAKRWKDIGFPVKHVHWEGVQHGFFPVGHMNRSKEAVDDFIDYLRVEL